MSLSLPHLHNSSPSTEPSSPPECGPAPVLLAVVGACVLFVVVIVTFGACKGCRKRSVMRELIAKTASTVFLTVLTVLIGLPHCIIAGITDWNDSLASLPIYSAGLPTGDHFILCSSRLAHPPPAYLPQSPSIDVVAPTRWIPPVFPLTPVTPLCSVPGSHRSTRPQERTAPPMSDRLQRVSEHAALARRAELRVLGWRLLVADKLN